MLNDTFHGCVFNCVACHYAEEGKAKKEPAHDSKKYQRQEEKKFQKLNKLQHRQLHAYLDSGKLLW